MEPDCYRVLCVDPSADRAGIETAYRRKAIKCHPDRGGCHRQMVLVNEAWEVLSNADLRRAYDEACAMAANQAEKPAPAPEVRPSKRQAPTTEPRWGMFEPLRIAIARDFAQANFRPGLRKWIGWSMFGDSLFGMAIPSIGALIGGLTVAKLLSIDPTWFSVRPFSAMAFMGAGTLFGGELAVKLHQWLARGVFAMAEPL